MSKPSEQLFERTRVQVVDDGLSYRGLELTTQLLAIDQYPETDQCDVSVHVTRLPSQRHHVHVCSDRLKDDTARGSA